MNARTKKLTTVAMLCAIAYLVMVIGRIPVVLFLKYDPKDVIITMGGFMFGPIASLAISVIVSLVEMFTDVYKRQQQYIRYDKTKRTGKERYGIGSAGYKGPDRRSEKPEGRTGNGPE